MNFLTTPGDRPAPKVRATVDYAFKRIFGDPERPTLTLAFLNAVLQGEPYVESVEILNPTLDKEGGLDKFAVLDVRVRDAAGRHYNVEVQTTAPSDLTARLLFYAARMLSGQLTEGDGYKNLRPVISIGVLERTFLRDWTQVHSEYRLRRSADGAAFSDLLQFHLLELSKLRGSVHTAGVASPLERWAWFLRSAGLLDGPTVHALFPEPVFQEAWTVLDKISRTPEERELYEARLKVQRDEIWRRESALSEGVAIGIERGFKRGIKAGRAEGRAEGRTEERRRMLLDFIETLASRLGSAVATPEELAASSVDELQLRVDELLDRIGMDRSQD